MTARGFTLYEVLISAALLGLIVVTALSMFPKAIETQKIARQKLYAATIAQELVTHHAEGSIANFRVGEDDYRLARSPGAPDLERPAYTGSVNDVVTLTNHVDDTAGSTRLFEPVPPAIVRRLDSDNHEIARLAEMGSPLFYMRHRAAITDAAGTRESSQEATETLVFGVVGYPQQNAVHHAQSSWWGLGNQDNYRRRTPTIGGSGRRRNNFYWPDSSPRSFPAHSYFWEHEALVLDPYTPAAVATFPAYPYDPAVDIDSGLRIRQEETNSLYMPFKPWERCRQLVFWSVDWKSYEDAETVAPATPDAFRYPVGNSSSETAWSPPRTYEWDLGKPTLSAATAWDRNFNGTIDSGRIPAPVRLRARTVARFNYYDKRLVTTY